MHYFNQSSQELYTVGAYHPPERGTTVFSLGFSKFHPPNFTQISFVDVSTLTVGDKDCKVGILRSPQSWNGWETAKRVISDSIMKGKPAAESGKVEGTQADRHYSCEPRIPG